jgi:hypothetical protein
MNKAKPNGSLPRGGRNVVYAKFSKNDTASPLRLFAKSKRDRLITVFLLVAGIAAGYTLHREQQLLHMENGVNQLR